MLTLFFALFFSSTLCFQYKNISIFETHNDYVWICGSTLEYVGSFAMGFYECGDSCSSILDCTAYCEDCVEGRCEDTTGCLVELEETYIWDEKSQPIFPKNLEKLISSRESARSKLFPLRETKERLKKEIRNEL